MYISQQYTPVPGREKKINNVCIGSLEDNKQTKRIIQAVLNNLPENDQAKKKDA